MTDSTLSTRYDPKLVEENWYRTWEFAGLFRPEHRRSERRFCITIPPPNVTGSLHMGHALCYSIQDVLGRWKRMQGFEVLILPGTDHAGIATQKVVESQLREEGKTRFDLGRELFVNRVWKWKEESGGTILKQFKRLGFAFDWSRERFTMDPAYHDAVLKVFIDWFERGLIYRGKRIVNWDPGLKTSLSDIEVYDEVRRGKLYHFKYPFADGSGHIVIATTRPETMLADVAVAVNPTDKRYSALVGKTIRLPLVGREIPLIADEYPDPEFGTGAVKVTPAHDPNDYEIGLRMGIDINRVPVCIDENAKVIAEGTPYHGLDRYEARKRIVADLEGKGLVERIEDYDIPLKISDRSGQVIEPLLSEQWFCKMKELAAPAIEAVRSGEVRFSPPRYADVYLNWMENIRDWCLSRQLWWGHRVPVYYTEEGDPIAAMNQQEAEQKAGGPVTPDPDVLDTWFSSALWPFATLGWPNQTDDLEKYYPTNVLVTSRDIIYLWVARMIVDGIDQMKKIPFHDVYIYATVLTEDGKRMSKSLGTGVDPIEYIDNYGADAMRFSLLVQTGFNQEIRFGDKRIEDARNFCNKIWNASRFVLMNLEGYSEGELENLQLEDKWILSKLYTCSNAVNTALNGYNMMDACKALQDFFWSDFCDWYIEIVKSRLASRDTQVIPQRVLHRCLETYCRLLHPFMPHITEEIWHKLPGVDPDAFLDYVDWPVVPTGWKDEAAENEMARLQEIVREARSLRQEFGLSPGLELPVVHIVGFDGDTELIRTQARFERVENSVPSEVHVSSTVVGVDIHLPIQGLVDPAKEIVRLERELAKLEAELMPLKSRLANPSFVERAKPEIVQRDKDAAAAIEDQIAKVQSRMAQFRSL
jgi:valyl-tRNA synthetase